MGNDTKPWLWRAWTERRERIADCGIVNAPNEDRARRYAWMCLGGPHASAVVEIQVEEVAS